MEEVQSAASWLSSDTRFKRIQQIFIQNCFSFIRIDLTDQKKMAELAFLLKEHNMTPDTLYLSNIRENLQYSSENSLRDFNASISQILSKDMAVIEASSEIKNETPPRQQLYRLSGVPVHKANSV
ncbi:hypothetical protein SCG7109_BG_00010 [Chlamydiales bacterium SCGC AG-110-M15]|nr:hypothetical protein SCG7109_BG_00010 [Chlamydiales bacterium SCGC AG-110-M15]